MGILKHNQKGSMLGRVRYIIYSTNMIHLHDVTWRGVSFFSAKLVRTITFLFFQIGQLYLVCGCMTIRRCVVYRNDLLGTLQNCFFLVITDQDYPCQHIDQWPRKTRESTTALATKKNPKTCVCIKRVRYNRWYRHRNVTALSEEL
jgi:hypothetical protein